LYFVKDKDTYKLVTMFDISVGQFIFPDKPIVRSTQRRQLDGLIDSLDETDLIVLEAVAQGFLRTKTAEKPILMLLPLLYIYPAK